jgi:hypothetical protein
VKAEVLGGEQVLSEPLAATRDIEMMQQTLEEDE